MVTRLGWATRSWWAVAWVGASVVGCAGAGAGAGAGGDTVIAGDGAAGGGGSLDPVVGGGGGSGGGVGGHSGVAGLDAGGARVDGVDVADMGGVADTGAGDAIGPDGGTAGDTVAPGDASGLADSVVVPDGSEAADVGAAVDGEGLDAGPGHDASPLADVEGVLDAGGGPDGGTNPDVADPVDAQALQDVGGGLDTAALPDAGPELDVAELPDVAEVPDVVSAPDVAPGADVVGAPDASSSPDVPADADVEADAGGPLPPFPYSWDGSFEPKDGDFPMAGLLDDEYFDGHAIWTGEISPVLPPGQWDWNDANDDLANWHNFQKSIGSFTKLIDDQGNHYGWRLQGNVPTAVDYAGASAYFEGTPGIDVLDLGPEGLVHSFTNGNLGDGPDVLIFDGAWSLDFRTGSSLSGAKWDNDLVIGGCNPDPEPGYQFKQATIHTGPGSDWIFALDMGGAAIDAGNGDGGKTHVLDPEDGDDLVVLHGNMRDFRVFGGSGDDTMVWYVDEGKESIAFLGPNFFGGGGSGDAVWGDPGTDRLILVIPPDTEIVDKTPTPPGAMLVTIIWDYTAAIWWDGPVNADPFAKYCVTCGYGPGERKTVTLEYKSATTPAFTGYFWVTAIEELQLGVGPDAVMYRIDDVAGELIPAPDLVPYAPPERPEGVCNPEPW